MSQSNSSKSTALQILGLKEDASIDEVRDAYKALSLQWHPSHRDEQYSDDEDDDYDYDEYEDEEDQEEVAFGPFAFGEANYEAFLNMYEQWQRSAADGEADEACACPECYARMQNKKQREAAAVEARARRRAEQAMEAKRREAEEADKKIQQEDPKSSMAWQMGGESRRKLIREHFLRQTPRVDVNQLVNSLVVVTLMVDDTSLLEDGTPFPPYDVDWDVSFIRTDAPKGAKWTVEPGMRECATKELSLRPGTEYSFRARTGLQGAFTWTGQQDWGAWGPTVKLRTAGEGASNAKGKKGKKKDRAGAFFGGGGGGGGKEEEEEEEEEQQQQEEEEEEEQQQQHEDEQEEEEEVEGSSGGGAAGPSAEASTTAIEAPSGAGSDGEEQEDEEEEAGASSSAAAGSSAAPAKKQLGVALEKKKKLSKHQLRLQRRQAATAGAEASASASGAADGDSENGDGPPRFDGNGTSAAASSEAAARQQQGGEEERVAFNAMTSEQQVAFMTEQYKKKGTFRPKPQYAPPDGPVPVPLFYSLYDPCQNSYMARWLRAYDPARANALEDAQTRIISALSERQSSMAAAAAAGAPPAADPYAAASSGGGGGDAAAAARRAQVQSLMAAVAAAQAEAAAAAGGGGGEAAYYDGGVAAAEGGKPRKPKQPFKQFDDGPMPLFHQPKYKQQCTFFARAACRKGNRCPFRHDQPAHEPAYPEGPAW